MRKKISQCKSLGYKMKCEIVASPQEDPRTKEMYKCSELLLCCYAQSFARHAKQNQGIFSCAQNVALQQQQMRSWNKSHTILVYI